MNEQTNTIISDESICKEWIIEFVFFFVQEVVVLSDDEASTELKGVNVKMEPGTSKNAANALEIGLIDLTDDIFEDADIPRHYISWLSDLLEKAKIQPTVVEQQPSEETATASGDVVLVEEPTESGQVSSSLRSQNIQQPDLLQCLLSHSIVDQFVRN